MRDTKYIESNGFHTGVAHVLIKQISQHAPGHVLKFCTDLVAYNYHLLGCKRPQWLWKRDGCWGVFGRSFIHKDNSTCWCFMDNGVSGDAGMELWGKDIINKGQQCVKYKAKQASNCRSIDCKFKPHVQAAIFIKNGPQRMTQSGIASLICTAQATHHTWQSMFARPVVQRAQAMDHRAVEKCDYGQIKHPSPRSEQTDECTCGANLKDSTILSAWFQQRRVPVVL